MGGKKKLEKRPITLSHSKKQEVNTLPAGQKSWRKGRKEDRLGETQKTFLGHLRVGGD